MTTASLYLFHNKYRNSLSEKPDRIDPNNVNGNSTFVRSSSLSKELLRSCILIVNIGRFYII